MIGGVFFVANHAPAVEANDTTSQRGDDVRIMRCNDHRYTGAINLDQQFHDLPADQRIKVASWLVGNQELRVADNRSGDGGALLLSAGKFCRIATAELCESNDTERTLNSGINLFARGPGDLKGEGGVLPDGAARQQAEVLEDNPDAAAQEMHLARRQCVHGMAGDMHLARRGRYIAHEQADQGRLSRSRWTNQEDELTTV